MVPMSERLMFQLELLLSKGEAVEAFCVRGEWVVPCWLTGRGSGADSADCWLIRKTDSKGKIFHFTEVGLSDLFAARLERMAEEADREARYGRHLANSGGSRSFWRGLRGAA